MKLVSSHKEPDQTHCLAQTSNMVKKFPDFKAQETNFFCYFLWHMLQPSDFVPLSQYSIKTGMSLLTPIGIVADS